MEFDFQIKDAISLNPDDGIYIIPAKMIQHLSYTKGMSKSQENIWGQKCLSNYKNKLHQIIDVMGNLSAKAQGLKAVITTYEKIIACNDNIIYIKAEKNMVQGFIKTGYKHLFQREISGKITEINPLCVLDFYVHESCQRMGVGKELFEKMLQQESIIPEKLAYDRPSPKLISFLKKHYGLVSYIPQSHNFVVYNSYFDSFRQTQYQQPNQQQQTGNQIQQPQNQKLVNQQQNTVSFQQNTQIKSSSLSQTLSINSQKVNESYRSNTQTIQQQDIQNILPGYIEREPLNKRLPSQKGKKPPLHQQQQQISYSRQSNLSSTGKSILNNSGNLNNSLERQIQELESQVEKLDMNEQQKFMQPYNEDSNQKEVLRAQDKNKSLDKNTIQQQPYQQFAPWASYNPQVHYSTSSNQYGNHYTRQKK